MCVSDRFVGVWLNGMLFSITQFKHFDFCSHYYQIHEVFMCITTLYGILQYFLLCVCVCVCVYLCCTGSLESRCTLGCNVS
jgi:hypothetical protein